jgi:hypothetical protein
MDYYFISCYIYTGSKVTNMSMPGSQSATRLWKCILYAYRTSWASCSYWNNFLAFCLYRLNKGELRPDHHVGFELASLYFHWVDFVWLLVFIVYYWDHSKFKDLKLCIFLPGRLLFTKCPSQAFPPSQRQTDLICKANGFR